MSASSGAEPDDVPAARRSAERLAALVGRSTLHPPVAATLAVALRGLVADGRLPVGGRLPAERELAAALGVSRVTVTSAYARLRESGWAASRRGAGTWTSVPDRSGVVAAFVPGSPRDGTVDLTYASPAGPPEVADAYAAALEALPRMLPGHGYVAGGLADLRARVAERMSARGLPTAAEQVLVTTGASAAISGALRAVAGPPPSAGRGGAPGARVLVEHPTWPNALDLLGELGAVAVPVPRDPRAPDGAGGFPAALHRAARETAPAMAYLVPDFANPTGAVLTPEERQRVVASMEQRGVVVLADETLADLALEPDDDPSSRPPLAASARPGAVLTAGSLSKSVWAGLRVGWLRGEPSVLARVAASASRDHGALPVVDQLAACVLLDGLDSGLVERRARLREQRDALVGALRDRFPAWDVPLPAGGLSLWCRLPRGTSSSAVTDAAERHGLFLATGSRFGTGHAFDDHLRLPFTQPVPVLLDAVDRLARAVADAERAWGAPTTTRTGALMG
ncbi:PLP-dependent aminotransferase family protein [Pseudokineococcus marinus]|uniref:PLP-dependent aminotransferase family protein n=1 Tax=Pseudokineococcus marinus TaxID=351215 RepID=A0A849BR18_9ACTN|nr:PLP-dependent aminotransferase family protein [Pseudokineococcus marinus]NNH22954.1 PLP-dependent aminotransferase family protein [Pseudokineococcus marinus]